MIIVWLSIALVILAVIWLAFRAVNESKQAKKTVIRVSKSVEILKKNSESILKANEKLQETAGNITDDFAKKAENVNFVKEQTEDLAGTIRDSKNQVTEAYRTLKNKIGV